MSWTGEPGSEGYVMTKKECIISMARLSLTGKLRRAVSEIEEFLPDWYNVVPAYDWNRHATPEEVLFQISLKSFASQYDTLWERVLSILLKKFQEKRLD